jgi:L-lactate dehydrogenase complex protein LldG
MSREAILSSIRSALGRSAGDPVAPVPEARIRIPQVSVEARIEQFTTALRSLNAEPYLASDPADACRHIAALLEGKKSLASNAPLLESLGITLLPGVVSGVSDLERLRDQAAHCNIGITSASYALADTGTLVMLSSVQEARLISLLPPVHLAVIERSQVLSGLDELCDIVPRPAEKSSSMVLITGPSRTADIEQILVRGVHGPGELHVVIL